MNKVAIFFGTGYEEIEALTVVDILRRAQIDITMVSITGKMEVTGSHDITVRMDELIENLNFDDVDTLVLPGGQKGTENLEACTCLMQQVDRFVKENKMVAAICAAPSILGHRGILSGKKACSYPTFESHLEGADVLQAPAVCDGNIVTGRGMGAAVDFALMILSKLKDDETACEMAEKIVYQTK